jgi:8-oxo-dGTP pyrophosphatase MutT (NUDIX family)
MTTAKREIKEEIGISIGKLIEKFTIKREKQTEFIFIGYINEQDEESIQLDDENSDFVFLSVDKIADYDMVPNVMDYIRIVLGVSEYIGK